MIPVGWLAPAGCWDQTHLHDLLESGPLMRFHAGYPPGDGAVIVVPGRYWAGHEPAVAEALAKYRWVLLIVTSDEESLFGTVEHPNMRLWVQTPRQGRDYGDAFLFGVGYTPHSRTLVKSSEKTLNVFLSAQNTHPRRGQCFVALEGLRDSRVHSTAGFTQGMDPSEYMACMTGAKIAPCPSGAVSVDSFRVWEALQAGALPVVDTVSPVDGITDYWARLFGDVPFPVVADWSQVQWGALLDTWSSNMAEVQAWWKLQKRRYAERLVEDLKALGAA